MKCSPKSSKNFPPFEYQIQGEAEFAIVDETGLPALIEFLETQSIVAVDTETQSKYKNALDPHLATIRLIQIGFPQAQQAVIVDCNVTDARPLVDALCREDLKKVFHNKKFDRKMFFGTFGKWLPNCDCTYIMSNQIAMGSGYKSIQNRGHRLTDLTKAFFGIDMDKALQKSEWGGELTLEQFEYAALDVGGPIGSGQSTLLRLHALLKNAVEKPFPNESGWGLSSGFICASQLDQDAEDVIAEIEYFGMPLAPAVIESIHRSAREKQQKLLFKLVRELNLEYDRDPITKEIEIPRVTEVLLNNPKGLVEKINQFLPEPLDNLRSEYLEEVLEKLKKKEEESKEEEDEEPEDFEFGIQLIDDLLEYKELTKLLSIDYRDHAHPLTHRLHGEFSCIGTSTGRLSSRGSGAKRLNVQQISSVKIDIDIDPADLFVSKESQYAPIPA